MPINPLIFKKIDELNVPPEIQKLLKTMIQVEEQIEIQGGNKKDFFKTYDNILDKFAGDEKIIQFVDSYESK